MPTMLDSRPDHQGSRKHDQLLYNLAGQQKRSILEGRKGKKVSADTPDRQYTHCVYREGGGVEWR